LQVFSWEPLRCHDMVDVGWHKLADLCIHEGKLLGCSFNQSCVGVWVVDLQVHYLFLFVSGCFFTSCFSCNLFCRTTCKKFWAPSFSCYRSIVQSTRACCLFILIISMNLRRASGNQCLDLFTFHECGKRYTISLRTE